MYSCVDCFQVLLDVVVDSDEWPQIVSGAQRIWIETWGPARLSGTAQRSNFASQKQINDSDVLTESSWRRKRRHDIDAAIQNLPCKSRSQMLHEATAASASTWNPSMGSRENWLLEHQAEDRAHALCHKEALLPSDISDHTRLDAEIVSRKLVAADAQHDRKK